MVPIHMLEVFFFFFLLEGSNNEYFQSSACVFNLNNKC